MESEPGYRVKIGDEVRVPKLPRPSITFQKRFGIVVRMDPERKYCGVQIRYGNGRPVLTFTVAEIEELNKPKPRKKRGRPKGKTHGTPAL